MTKKMTETDVLKAMNDLPEEWLESCSEETETLESEENNRENTRTVRFGKFGKTAVKWAVAATAVLLLCGVGVGVTKWGLNQVHASKKTEFLAYTEKLGIYEPGLYPFYTGKERNAKGEETDDVYFYLLAEAERITAEELTGEIHEVRENLLQQLAEVDYSRRWDYPKWSKEYKTVEEAKAYIGYAGMKETKALGTLDSVYVNVKGDKKGNLAEVVLAAGYTEGDMLLTETIEIFTEESQSSIHWAGIATFDVSGWGESFRKEEYTNKNGKTAAIVYEERTNEKERDRLMHGVLTEGAVCYELILWYHPKDLKRAKEIMYEWCEQF